MRNLFSGLLLLLLSFGSYAALPAGAKEGVPILKTQVDEFWPEYKYPHYLAAQVQAESNWKQKAELKTSREYGFGYGQFTKTAKFNKFDELKSQYRKQLSGWTWEDRFNQVFQLRAVVLMNKGLYDALSKIPDPLNRTYMMFSAYNGGLGGLLKDRALCQKTPNCNPNVWFGNVAETSTKAKVAVSGYGRSFYQINRDYIVKIDKLSVQYKPLFESNK